MKRLFREYIFFIITTTVVPTTVVPHNIDYVRSSLAASMYASLFSKISGEVKKSIMGGILAELLVEGLGRTSFLPEKLKKGKIFFYKFLVPPIVLCWWMKEGYSFTKELFTPQEKLEFDSNHQIKEPTQYLFYLNTRTNVILDEINKILKLINKFVGKNAQYLQQYCFYDTNDNKDNDKNKMSLTTFFTKKNEFDQGVCNVLEKIEAGILIETEDVNKKEYDTSVVRFLSTMLHRIDTMSVITIQEKKESAITNSNEQIEKIGELLKTIPIEKKSRESKMEESREQETDVKWEMGEEVIIKKYFDLRIDYIIAEWQKNLFFDVYYQNKWSWDTKKKLFSKINDARKNIEESWLYQKINERANGKK